MKFKKIPSDVFQTIQLNAGVLLPSFTPATPTFSADNIIGATSGGINFTAAPSFTDFGEDIDNCPKNTMELKKLDTWEVKMTGTFVSAKTALAKRLLGAADIDGTDSTKVVPRQDVTTADFQDLWFVGDYSNYNGETHGGFIAIHMMNTLSTGGFSLQTADAEKGQFTFEFTGHYSISAQTTVPFEIYIGAGAAE